MKDKDDKKEEKNTALDRISETNLGATINDKGEVEIVYDPD